MTNLNIFDFNDYKTYLIQALGSVGQRTGRRGKAARAMDCQTAYVSQVLNGNAHFSLEQAIKLSHHLGHTSLEEDYFLNLVNQAKAGNSELREHYGQKLKKILADQLVIKNRLGSNTQLTLADQSRYYSKWYYSALHILVTLPEFQTREKMAAFLNLPLAVVAEALEFLEKTSLVEATPDGFKIGRQKMHLGHDSANVQKHHSNWRLKAMQSLDQEKEFDLHYSVVFSLAEPDAAKVKERLLKCIQDCLKIVEPSKEERLYCLSMDLFDLKH